MEYSQILAFRALGEIAGEKIEEGLHLGVKCLSIDEIELSGGERFVPFW